MQGSQTRFFLLVGAATWAAGTLLFQQAGAVLLQGSAARFWLVAAVVVGAFVAAFRLAAGLRRVRREGWMEAAVAMSLPGMLGEVPVLFLFGGWMDGMRPETAGRFAALLFCGYAALLLYATVAARASNITVVRVPPLRTTLLADAAVCLVAGAVLLGFAGPLTPLLATEGFRVLGLAFAPFARAAGAAVLLIGLGVYAAARAHPIRPAAVHAILLVEVLWIAGSAALLAAEGARLTLAGTLVVITGAIVVGGFAIAEWLGWRTERARIATPAAPRPSSPKTQSWAKA